MLTLVFNSAPEPYVAPDRRVVTRWSDDRGHEFAIGLAAGDQRWIDWAGLGLFSFDTSSTTVRLTPTANLAQPETADYFSRIVQPLILQAQGWPVLHGSATAGPNGAVIFCGLSGSGKSTLAYAVGTRDGFEQIADDAVVVRATSDGTFAVVPIPFRPRLRPTATEHFGPLVTSPTPMGVRPPLPLRAVIVLAQGPGDGAVASLTAVPRTSAFSILLTHAHCFDEGDKAAVAQMTETYLAMADAVPVFRVSYRPDFSEIDQLARMVAQVVVEPLPT